MTISLRGYTVTEQLFENLNTVVYRGIRQGDQLPVVLKVLKAEYPTSRDIGRLQHEYRLTHDLTLPGVVQAYSLEDYNNGLVLVSEDFGGTALINLIRGGELTFAQKLSIALQVTETLTALHALQIIHKDIKPQNIIVNLGEGLVKITDFGIASRLSRESQALLGPMVLEGTLAYISPEQTGRMNRMVDYRTDYYSLGVTLYELFTGQLPFFSEDPMELIHGHIARQPIPPQEVQEDLPPVLSALILKLLAKTAEERYQSSHGLAFDLRTCQQQWERTRRIIEFPLAQRDISERFEICQTLYGREQEAETLRTTFERVSQGQSELMLVYGYSGIGKSALIYEIHRPLVRTRGYFISGKFDQFQRGIPYSSVIQAFQELVQQLLAESEARLKVWRDKLLAALGNNGQIIIDVIPVLEQIIGPQSEVSDLPPAESLNRFNKTVQDFVRVFAQVDHPLVLFLDDLQCADSATLKLIQVLTTDLSSKHLLLIGAYRDNEVSPSHPLMLTLETILKGGATVNQVCLGPLSPQDVNSIISDSLRCSRELSLPLGELIFSKTQGNPFFISEFLKFIYQEGLLNFNQAERYWQWDFPRIEALNVTDNVVDLMTRKVTKLEPSTQAVLKLAACIGSRFDLQRLGVVNEKSATETAQELWEAISAGLVVPLQEAYKFADTSSPLDLGDWSVSYKFLHDRVQQAVYGLTDETERPRLHLRIGRLMLEHTPEEQRDEKLFDIVNQLNIGIPLSEDSLEKLTLARLDLQAGQKARGAAAYEAAYGYVNTGLTLLSETYADPWESEYELTFHLTQIAAECAYLTGALLVSEELSNLAFQQANTNLDKAKICRLKIRTSLTSNKLDAAIDWGRQGLALLGTDLPIAPEEIQQTVQLEAAEIQAALAGCKIEDLINSPEVVNPEERMILELLGSLFDIAYIFRKDLFGLFTYKTTNLCLQLGLDPLATSTYMAYGLFQGSMFGDFKTGFEFGKLSLKIAEKYNIALIKGRINLTFGIFMNPWNNPLKTTQKYFEEGYQNGIEAGDFPTSTYCIVQLMGLVIEQGSYLETCYEESRRYVDFLKKQKSMLSEELWYASTCQEILKLQGLAQPIFQLEFSGQSCNESQLEEKIYGIDRPSMCLSLVSRLRTAYFLEDYPLAHRVAADLSQDIAFELLGQHRVVEHNFYSSLCLAALYESATAEEQAQYWQTLEANQRQMRLWAEHCEANFQHKYLLVAAEMARLSRAPIQAADLYDQAIEAAHDQEFTHCEALSNELAGKFYLTRDKQRIAKAYLQEARLVYLKWGAAAKVALLDQQFGELLSIGPVAQDFSDQAITVMAATSSTTTGDGRVLDLMTVIKASQALSSEMVLSKLLERLLRIVLENAGARKTALILVKEGRLMVEATGVVDPQPTVVLQSMPLDESTQVPTSICNYVYRTEETLVLSEAWNDDRFSSDPYVIEHRPQSALGMPIIRQRKLVGILYLENNLSTGVFTVGRLEILRLLMAQVSTCIENATLYANLQQYSQELEDSFTSLQNAQLQLIQSEKMSSLGLLVAGVAHEINNPVSFIASNLDPANQYVQDLLDLLNVYEQDYPSPIPAVQEKIEEIDLEFTREDLPRLLTSMGVGIDRIRQLSVSLRNFSRSDQVSKSAVDLHEGIDSTLMILEHRIKAKPERPRIQIVKNYGTLPRVSCYAGQLNQVFMNLLANAIDVFDETAEGRTYQDIEAHPNQIEITTEQVTRPEGILAEGSPALPFVRIRLRDNGPGMPEAVKAKIFESLFTTKAVGKGTGLGLSISRQIVVEKHGGRLDCLSAPGAGAEFIVEIPLQ